MGIRNEESKFKDKFYNEKEINIKNLHIFVKTKLHM